MGVRKLSHPLVRIGCGGDAVTTPAYEIEANCEACGETYADWRRDSVNLMVSPMTEEEVDEQLSTTCPACGHRDSGLGLIVDREVPNGS